MAASTASASARTCTPLEAADQLGVHYMTAYRYVRTGRLPATKQGSQWEVAQRDLDAFAARPGPTRGRGPGRTRVDHTERLVCRLGVGDEAGAWSVVQHALAGGRDPSDLYLDVLAPAMARIGDRWEAGRLSVGDEHQAAAVMLRLLGRLGPLFTRPGRSRGTVVLGAPAGDRHGLPAALFGDLLRGRGLAVAQLGADTPAPAFVEAAAAADRLVAVAVTATVADNEASVAATVSALHEAGLGPVVVGGRAVATPEQARGLGADLHGGQTPDALDLMAELAGQAQRERRRARRLAGSA
jgi:MerR family transcriptional regulator, light-induced transcriptional regulator